MVLADWRYNEEVRQWETIIHCTSEEELREVIKQLKHRKILHIVKGKHVIVFKYISVHRLEKILGLEVEY